MKCPICKGEGITKLEFQPTYVNKYNKIYSSEPIIIDCETCKGTGSVNRFLISARIMFGRMY